MFCFSTHSYPLNQFCRQLSVVKPTNTYLKSSHIQSVVFTSIFQPRHRIWTQGTARGRAGAPSEQNSNNMETYSEYFCDVSRNTASSTWTRPISKHWFLHEWKRIENNPTRQLAELHTVHAKYSNQCTHFRTHSDRFSGLNAHTPQRGKDLETVDIIGSFCSRWWCWVRIRSFSLPLTVMLCYSSRQA